jgi:hypothetical protein
MFKTKFKKAIEKCIACTSPIEQSRAKAAITRIVKDATELDVREQIKEVLISFDKLPEWVKNRFTSGSLYREGNSMFGWFRENQVQTEVLPVITTVNGFEEEGYLRVIESRDGFQRPVDIPLAEGDCVVSVPYEQSFFYAKYGWANPCPLQWYRDAEGYKIDRSIIPHGFWQAWKWWDGAWHWYIKNRPELFEDFGCWGLSWNELGEIHTAKPDPGSAVLGDANKEFWESKKFYLE